MPFQMIKDDEKQQEQEQQEENYEEEEEEESSSQFLSILCRFLTESSTSKQKGRGVVIFFLTRL